MRSVLTETARTKHMESIAPPKAASTISKELTGRPWFRRRIMTRATASFAPEEIPRTKGPAIGLWKKVCRAKPDTDRPPPRRTAARARGKRICQTILQFVGSPSRRKRILKISPGAMDTDPEAMFTSSRRSSAASRNAKTAPQRLYPEPSAIRAVLSFLPGCNHGSLFSPHDRDIRTPRPCHPKASC